MKLLKLLTAIVIASAATFTATAQDNAYFGVRAAYDMCTSTKNSYMTSWGSGFSVGGVYFAPFGKLTFFQPGLMFYADNIRIDGTTKNEDNRHTYDGNIRTYGLRMPLDFGLKVIDNKVIGLNVYTGPHLYFNFSSKMICDDTYYGKTTHINEKLSTPGMELGGRSASASMSASGGIYLQKAFTACLIWARPIVSIESISKAPNKAMPHISGAPNFPLASAITSEATASFQRSWLQS